MRLPEGQQRQAVLSSVLRQCASSGDLSAARELGHKLGPSCSSSTFLGNHLVLMYSGCGSPADAQHAFEQMERRNVFSWNILLSAYVQGCETSSACSIWSAMPQHSVVSYNTMLAAYAQAGDVQRAWSLFKSMPEADTVSWNTMLQGIDPGLVADVFQAMPKRDVVSWTSLLACQHRPQHASTVFALMPAAGLASWNALLQAYAYNGEPEAVLEIFQQMPERDIISWTSLLQSVDDVGHVTAVFDRMPGWDSSCWTALLGTYAQNGCLQEATREVFGKKMRHRDAASWSAMMRTCSQHGFQDAELVFCRMPEWNTASSNCMVAAYAMSGQLESARALVLNMPAPIPSSVWSVLVTGHAQAGDLERAWDLLYLMPQWDLSCCNVVVAAMAQRGLVEVARSVFDAMQLRDAATWNSVIHGYAQCGRAEVAVTKVPQFNTSSWNWLIQLQRSGGCGKSLFDDMLQRNVVSWTLVVQQLLDEDERQQAMEVFHKMPQQSVVSWNLVLQAYARNGDLALALRLFSDTMPQRDIVSWTTVVVGLASSSRLLDSKEALYRMPQWDAFSWNAAVQALLDNGYLEEARDLLLHSSPVASGDDPTAWNALVSAYADRGLMQESEAVLKQIQEPNVVTWNAMITAYGQNSHPGKSRDVFDRMGRRNLVSWNALLAACKAQPPICNQIFQRMPLWNTLSYNALIHALAQSGDSAAATSLFDASPQRNAASWNALLCARQPGVASRSFQLMPARELVSWNCMLAACSGLDEARQLFQQMPARNSVSWNTMIAACAQAGAAGEALRFLCCMDSEGERAQEITFACAIAACAAASLLEQGVCLHADAVNSGCHHHVLVGTALVNMYSECGRLGTANELFQQMPIKSVASWNALLTANARYSASASLAVLTLLGMMQLEGVTPDDITAISLLSGYSHAGRVDDGLTCFVALVAEHGLVPSMEHYKCLVDLLGRSGRLEEAEDVVSSMPFEPDSLSWTTLLGACKSYGDAERAVRVGRQVLHLDQNDSTTYVLMSSATRPCRVHLTCRLAGYDTNLRR